MKQKKKVITSKKRRPTKSDCRFYDVGNCYHFGCRCFDCKEYKAQPSYRRERQVGESYGHIY